MAVIFADGIFKGIFMNENNFDSNYTGIYF